MINVVHGTLDPASDPHGYARLRRSGSSVITIGKFDGVHRAHQFLLSRTLAEARHRGLQAGVVTFDTHPREVIHATNLQYLTTAAERTELFAQAGMSFVLLLRATKELFAGEAEDFWANLVSALDCRAVVVGANFRFGRGATGDVATLAHAASVDTIVLDLLASPGGTVSSTRIREELKAGRVDRAADLLGRPISVGGSLEAQDSNRWTVKVPPRMALPAPGLYSGHVDLTESDPPQSHPAAVLIEASSQDATRMQVMPHSSAIRAPLPGQPVRVVFEQRQPDKLLTTPFRHTPGPTSGDH